MPRVFELASLARNVPTILQETDDATTAEHTAVRLRANFRENFHKVAGGDLHDEFASELDLRQVLHYRCDVLPSVDALFIVIAVFDTLQESVHEVVRELALVLHDLDGSFLHSREVREKTERGVDDVIVGAIKVSSGFRDLSRVIVIRVFESVALEGRGSADLD